MSKDIFKNMTRLEDLYPYGKELLVEKGDVIGGSMMDNDDDAIFILAKGTAALSTLSNSGNEFIYMYFRGPHCIGFAPFFSKHHHDEETEMRYKPHSFFFMIVAKTSCTVYRIPKEQFELLFSRPDVKDLLLHETLDNYRDILDHYALNQDDSAVIRLCYLLDEQSFPDARGKRRLDSCFTYSELSKYLGVHDVTVARIMSSLKKQGIIEKDGHSTILLDREKLLWIINRELEIKY